jgi:hypothetical protein
MMKSQERAMKTDEQIQTLFDLTDELLVVSALLDMITLPAGSSAQMLEMCTTSTHRCQGLVARLGGEGSRSRRV